MIPRAFDALVKRRNAERRHGLYCAALTAAATYNVNRKEGTDPITPDDLIGTDSAHEEKRMTVEETRSVLKLMAESLGTATTQ